MSDKTRREILMQEILNIKKDIQAALDLIDLSNGVTPSFNVISPEQANFSKRQIVFLKRDLAAKQLELDQFDGVVGLM